MCFKIDSSVKGLPFGPHDTFSNARRACLTFHSSKLPSYCYFCQFNTPAANLQAWQSNKIMRGLRQREAEEEKKRMKDIYWRENASVFACIWACTYDSIHQLETYLWDSSLFILATKTHLFVEHKNPCCGNTGVLRGQRRREGEKRSVLCRCVSLPWTST